MLLAKIKFIGLLIGPFLVCAALAGLAWLLDCPLWAVLDLLAIGVELNALLYWGINENLHVS